MHSSAAPALLQPWQSSETKELNSKDAKGKHGLLKNQAKKN
jgi:hypothetical protein